MKTGAERQKTLKKARLAAGLKLSNVWLPESTLIQLRQYFPGPRGGIDWTRVADSALAEVIPAVTVGRSEVHSTEEDFEGLELVEKYCEPVTKRDPRCYRPRKKPEYLDPKALLLFKNHIDRPIHRHETGDEWRREALARLGIDFDSQWLRLRKNDDRRLLLGRGRRNVPWARNITIILQTFAMGEKRPKKPDELT